MIALSIQSIADHPWIIAIGWSLLHFVWQALLIGLVVAMFLALCKKNAARTRYWIACVGLLAMSVSPLVTTGIYLHDDELSRRHNLADVSDSIELPAWNDEAAQFLVFAENNEPVRVIPDFQNEPASSKTDSANLLSTGARSPSLNSLFSKPASLDKTLTRVLPWCACVWFLGVGLLTLRLFAGFVRVRRWRRQGTQVKSHDLQITFHQLVRRMNIHLPVALLQSTSAAVPMVVGWLKPAVLLPPSLLTSLSTAELESILAHELAHVRRFDQFVNLLQSITETLLFYHPAVWWVSRQIRLEREHCCDDIAVRVCGDALLYARALTRLEEGRAPDAQIALAANSGPLLRRIQRLVSNQNASATTAWPASLLAIGMLALLVVGLWMNTATGADATVSNQDQTDVDPKPLTQEESQDSQPKTKLEESLIKDSRSGIEQRVLTDIQLRCTSVDEEKQANVSMKYSNVIRYSFIPASVAKKLNAVEYGTIDFGDKSPQADGSFTGQTVDLNWETLRRLDASGDLSDSGTVQLGVPEQPPRELQELAAKRVRINELSKPLADDQAIIPYADDPLWVPGHLGFYGMNQTKQTKFRVVRIDQVSLGIGPSIGPVYALVNPDENSDFGLLGSDWARQVRGENGEGLWFSAADGTVRFMPPPQQITRQQGPPISLDGSGTVVFGTSPQDEADRVDQEGITVLKSHNYNLGRRESTGWVNVDGLNVPIDVGLNYGETTVYLTLMFDVVAVDSETKALKWKLDWRKTSPIWRRLSIVEIDAGDAKQIAVELFALAPRTQEPVYKYLAIETGEEIAVHPAGNQDKQVVRLNVIEEDKGKITRAELKAIKEGRSALDVAQALQVASRLSGELGDSITMNETLVSAQEASYIPHAIDAQEIIFNLPEGSGMRAEFSGEKVEVRERADGSTLIVVNHGKIEIIDSVGVVRAWASPDGGAEQLVIECRFAANEYSLKLRSQRLKEDKDYPNPPVQCVMRPDSGAPQDEGQPPHGAVRYDVQYDKDSHRMRFKIMWRYDVERVLREAAQQVGKDFDEFLREFRGEQPGPQIDFPPDKDR